MINQHLIFFTPQNLFFIFMWQSAVCFRFETTAREGTVGYWTSVICMSGTDLPLRTRMVTHPGTRSTGRCLLLDHVS